MKQVFAATTTMSLSSEAKTSGREALAGNSLPACENRPSHCSRSILQLQYSTDGKHNDFGYRFGYRHQFALISASYAKLQVGMGLAGSLITLNYAYLS
jgi:hypothetical protein